MGQDWFCEAIRGAEDQERLLDEATAVVLSSTRVKKTEAMIIQEPDSTVLHRWH